MSHLPMTKLYDDLAALDKKIADRWKIRAHDNDNHVRDRYRLHPRRRHKIRPNH
jgi:hypothetical protein